MKYQVGDLVKWNREEGKGDYFIITGISTDETVYFIKYLEGYETFEPTSTYFERETTKVG